MQRFTLKSFVCALCALAFTTTPSAYAVNPPQPTTNQNSTKNEFVDNSNTVGIKLLSELRQISKDSNTVISPVSVSVALSMLMNGADDATLQEMSTLLGVDAKALADFNKAVSDFLDTAIQADPKVELEIANAIFAQKGKKIDAQFLKSVQKEFQGRMKELDFKADPDAAKDKINEWVKQKTNGKIPTLLDQVARDTQMVLANAVYFKAAWTTPFDPKLTSDRQFTFPGGKRAMHPTMQRSGSMSYMETSTYQAVSLEYGENGRFAMDMYLPKSGTDLDTVVKSLDAQTLVGNAKKFQHSPGTLYLPKMKISWSMPLNDALKSLGMKLAFDPKQANFSKMFAPVNGKQESYSVDIIQHKTFMEVNEEGTEAAAVTGIGIVTITSVDTRTPFQMDVNRAFFFVIRDKDTGAIYFMGTICAPGK